MIRNILQMNDPILNTKCREIKEFGTKELSDLVRDLMDTCISKEEISAGLSAPQIGVSLQVCICRRMDLENKHEQTLTEEQLWEVMINPHIFTSSKNKSVYWEGCLSVGEGQNGLYGPVSRAAIVEIEYKNVTGIKKHIKCSGFFSHIVQHEIDHLKGIIFLKYVSNPDNIWLCKDLDDYYEKNGDYPPV
jgi:peptide deformylase